MSQNHVDGLLYITTSALAWRCGIRGREDILLNKHLHANSNYLLIWQMISSTPKEGLDPYPFDNTEGSENLDEFPKSNISPTSDPFSMGSFIANSRQGLANYSDRASQSCCLYALQAKRCFTFKMLKNKNKKQYFVT